jgi:AcrR family transcriptional regulator
MKKKATIRYQSKSHDRVQDHKKKQPSLFKESFFESFPELKLQKTKLKIFESTLKLISTQGVQSLTLANLSRVGGLSKPRILYYYPGPSTLEDILFELFQQLIFLGQQQTQKKQLEYHDPLMQMVAMYDVVIELNQNIQYFGNFFLLFFSQAHLKSQASQLHQTMLVTGEKRIFTLLQKLDIPSHSLLSLSRTLYALILGMSIRDLSVELSLQQRTERQQELKLILKTIVDSYTERTKVLVG